MRWRREVGAVAAVSNTLDGRTGPTVPRLLLGARLRRLRESAGATRGRAGEIIWGSESKISRMELGQVGSQDRDVADLAELYGLTEPARREMLFTLAHASRARQPASDLLPDWALTYIDLEAAASLIRTYEPQFIPGLLQTTGYARAMIAESHPGAAAADIERRASIRIERTQLLNRPDSPELWAVIDEAALHRLIGGPAVMRAQLKHLLEATNWPNITLQVMPAATGGHAGQSGAFSLLRFPYPELSDIVYIEHLTRGFHLDRPAEVEVYAQVVDKLATQAATPTVSAEIIAGIHDRI